MPDHDKRRPTVATISKEAGVALSTVSRALKNDPRIAEQTRKDIAAIAERIGYRPHANARTMVTGRSGLIGFIMGPSQNPFYPQLLDELVQSASNRSLRTMVLHAGQKPLDESAFETLIQYQMDGCIVTSAELSSRSADICRRFQVPVVMLNRVPRLHSCAVSCNNREGAKLLAELLVAGDHKRVAIVRGTKGTSTATDREAGAIEALRSHGLEPAALFEGCATYEGGVAAARAVLSAATRPDAILAANDIMAMGVIDTLRDKGLSVPDDISVVGFDDIPAAAWPHYSLTTVAQPIASMVTRALDLLEARMASADAPPETAYISGTLRVRSSCRLPKNLEPFGIYK